MRDDDPQRPTSADHGDEASGPSPEVDVNPSDPPVDSFDPSEQKTVLRPSGSSGRRASGTPPSEHLPLTDDLSPTVAVPPDSHTRRPSGPASVPSGNTTPGGNTDSIVRAGRFGKYEIFEKLGSGGFGKVYRGRDPMLSRDVAVKTCTSDDERLRRRFLHEAKIAAGLQHPNIVTVHDFGFEGDMPYMVQEYLTGEDLTEKIARRDLSVKERASYLLRIAQGLAYAHDHSVVHRDIKPGNIRITDDGQLRILDFGIARLLDQTRPFTTDGVTLGTVGYMAPELLSDDEVDWRCDIFSYGVVAYELLSYSLPFQGDTFVRISYRLLNEEPPSLAEVAPDCPPALIQLVERCLRKRREDRYTTFHQVVEELSRLLDDTGAQPTASPSTDNAPVLTVSGGAPTTPVPQVAVAAATTAPTPASTPISAPTSGPSPSGLPTAPVEGRRGFGMRHMAGLIGLGLGAVLVSMLLPGAVQEITSPAPTPDPAAHQATASSGEPSIAVPTPESSTAAPEDPSASDPEGAQGAAAPDSGEGAKQAVTASSDSEISPAANVRSDRFALPETSDHAPSVANEPRDVSSAIQPEAIDQVTGAVDPSPNRQDAADAPSISPETPEPLDPSLDAGRDEPAETTSSPASTAASTTLPAQPPTQSVVVDPSTDPGVTEPPPSVPAEVVPPQLLEQVQPEYPSRARRRRLEATVTVVVWVEADGSVERTTVKSVSARGMGFEDAAKAAARKSRFAPGTEDGTPQAMWTEMVFQFRLSG